MLGEDERSPLGGGGSSPEGCLGSIEVDTSIQEEAFRQQVFDRLRSEGSKWAAPKLRSIQRAQKFINRLKRFVETDKEAIVKELRAVDMTLYLQEISAALVDVKQRDLSSFVQIAAELQLLYGPVFTQSLSTSIRKVKETLAPGPKQRTHFKLLIEMQLCGVQPDHEPMISTMLIECFENVVNLGRYVSSCRSLNQHGLSPTQTLIKESLPTQLLTWVEYHNLQTIETIAKRYPFAVFGLKTIQTNGSSESIDLLRVESNGPRIRCLSVDVQTSFRLGLEKYIRQKCIVMFLIVHEALFAQEQIHQLQRLQRVVVDAENETRLTHLHQLKDRCTAQFHVLMDLLGIKKRLRLQSIFATLSKLILAPTEEETAPLSTETSNETFPPEFFPRFLIEDFALVFPRLHHEYISPTSRDAAGLTRLNAHDGTAVNDQIQLDASHPQAIEEEVKWADAGEKIFYEGLSDMKDFIPPMLLGIRPPAKREEEGEENGPRQIEAEITEPEDVGTVEGDSKVEIIDEETDINAGSGNRSASKSAIVLSPFEQFVEEFLHFAATSGFVDASAATAVDSFARSFMLRQLNSKNNRRRLVKAFLSTTKTDLHILAPICRFIAVLGPYCPDVVTLVTTTVKKEADEILIDQSASKTEQKIKCVRYLGELCKFKLVAIGDVLELLSRLTNDFTSHSVELLSHTLESCGRFVAGTRGADIRLQNLLSKIARLKSARNLPTRVDIFLEDQLVILEAACQRMQGEMPLLWQKLTRGIVIEQLPPLRRYIQHLVWNDIGCDWDCEEDEPKALLRKFRRLPWDDPQVVEWLKEAFLELQYHFDVQGLTKCSRFLTALSSTQPQFVVSCVDELLETILSGLEESDTTQRQRRVLEARLLSVFSADKIVDTTLIMDVLYHLIGISTTPSAFASSHFRSWFDLVKEHALKSESLCPESELTSSLPPLDFVARLIELPPIDSNGRYQVSVYASPDEQVIEERVGILPNRLAEVLFRLNVTETSSCRKGDGLFRIKLACVILKGCASAIVKRSWPWKLYFYVVSLVHVVAHRVQTNDARLPIDIALDLREILIDINRSHASRDLCNLHQASVDLANELAAVTRLLQTNFADIARDCPLDQPDSLLVNFTLQTAIQTSPFHTTMIPLKQIDSDASDRQDAPSTDSDTLQQRDKNQIEEDLYSNDDDSNDNTSPDAHTRRPPTDLQFDKELDQLINDSMDSAKSTAQFGGSYARGVGEIRLPHHILRNRAGMKNSATLTSHSDANGSLDDGSDAVSKNDVRFTLVTKRGQARYQMRNLNAVAGSKLASALSKPVTESQDTTEDRQLIKQFVMDHIDRLGAEEHRAQHMEVSHRYRTISAYDDRPVMPNASSLTGISTGPLRKEVSSGKKRVGKNKDKPAREARRKTASYIDEED